MITNVLVPGELNPEPSSSIWVPASPVAGMGEMIESVAVEDELQSRPDGPYAVLRLERPEGDAELRAGGSAIANPRISTATRAITKQVRAVRGRRELDCAKPASPSRATQSCSQLSPLPC